MVLKAGKDGSNCWNIDTAVLVLRQLLWVLQNRGVFLEIAVVLHEILTGLQGYVKYFEQSTQTASGYSGEAKK